MNDFRTIIDTIGIDAIALWLSVKKKHVQTMRDRNSIPPDYWPVLVANVPKGLRADITFDKLYQIRQQRFSDGQGRGQ